MTDNIKKRWSGSGDLKTAPIRLYLTLQAIGGRVGEDLCRIGFELVSRKAGPASQGMPHPIRTFYIKRILVLLAILVAVVLSGCETLKTYDVHAQGELQRRQETRVITVYTPHGVQTCIIQGDIQTMVPAQCCPRDHHLHSRP